MLRTIIDRSKGVQTQDGAGVKLVRVLGHDTAESWDPFLMLDSFDTRDYEDYKKGFPTHPHRGIETVSYISKGGITHKDSLGNEKTIGDRQIQWMRAGSGIMHSEFFDRTDHLLGLQLWINLPARKKMIDPAYFELDSEETEEGVVTDFKKTIPREDVEIKVYRPKKEDELTISTDHDKTVFLFTLTGKAVISGEEVDEKTAVLMSKGDEVTIRSLTDDSEIFYAAANELGEPIAWGGPIVMNTPYELQEASIDLHNGTFIKKKTKAEHKTV